jgi:hypothetical protein
VHQAGAHHSSTITCNVCLACLAALLWLIACITPCIRISLQVRLITTTATSAKLQWLGRAQLDLCKRLLLRHLLPQHLLRQQLHRLSKQVFFLQVIHCTLAAMMTKMTRTWTAAHTMRMTHMVMTYLAVVLGMAAWVATTTAKKMSLQAFMAVLLTDMAPACLVAWQLTAR